MSLFDTSNLPMRDADKLRAFALTPKPPKPEDIIPVDNFTLNYPDRTNIDWMSDAELIQAAGRYQAFFDVECYPNYFLLCMKIAGKYLKFELNEIDSTYTLPRVYEEFRQLQKLEWILNNFELVGFYSYNYDLPLIRIALKGFAPDQLKHISNQIIFENINSYELVRMYDLPDVHYNHIDLFNVTPLKGSLKLYGGRLHCKRMQSMPIEDDVYIGEADKPQIITYCLNDLDITDVLAGNLTPQLELRRNLSRTFEIDLRSRSDAQIAEKVIGSEIERISGHKPYNPIIDPGEYYYYQRPMWLEYETPILKELLHRIEHAKFTIGEDGSIDLPDDLKDAKIRLGYCDFRVGIGGLHSSEKKISHKASSEVALIAKDVTSYYPSIILNEQLYPRHLGRYFLKVYKNLVDRRRKAKAEKDKVTADSLKITVNGSFGKLGNKYSVLYSPDLMMQVTVTGQLALLKLIELLETYVCPVISANTDGVLVKCPYESIQRFNECVQWWERLTGYTTEETRYKAIYSRDVNNYIAIDMADEVHTKGEYSEVGSSGNTELSKNPENLVCNDACKVFLSCGIPVEFTIRSCSDIRRFVTVRNVTGGALKSGVYLGKTVRWYYSTEMKGQIEYKKSGNKVPLTDGAMPLMELPDTLPDDLDYERYIAMANQMLKDMAGL